MINLWSLGHIFVWPVLVSVWSGPLCSEKLDVCNPGLCNEPKICTSSGQSYTCSCPEDRTGDDCNDIVEPPCTDALCRSKCKLKIRWCHGFDRVGLLSLTMWAEQAQQFVELHPNESLI